jgi:Arc-like DNA binding domain
MARQKPLVQVKFRLRQDILRKLAREAKRHGRSVNNEIGHRLEHSFDTGEDWREDRLLLITALRPQLEQTSEGRAILKRLEEADQKDAHKEFEDIMEGDKS